LTVTKGVFNSDHQRDYLKHILHLQQVSSPVATTALAEAMGVAPSSVTDMLKKLSRKGYINYRPYHGITLTGEGEKEAIKAVRRHRIVERFLTDMLGFEWHEAHEEALAFEHNISDEVERRMYVACNKPTVCPHGYPIPSSVEDTIVSGVPLYSLEPGQIARVVSVEDDEPDLLRFMDSLGIKPGVRIKVDGKDPFKGPMQAEIDSKKRTIGWHLANQVYVDKVS
jgi:DtxR family Mn-dependent transcriptional regulator